MSCKVIPMRPKMKGGTVAVLMRPGFDLVVHIDSKGLQTELQRVKVKGRAFHIGSRFAAKSGARFIPLMFG